MESEEQYDEQVMFPRWKKHIRPRMQIMRIFLDIDGFLLHCDKNKYFSDSAMTKHAWTHFLRQSSTLPDRKKSEVFETYRNVHFQTVGGANVAWKSKDDSPVVQWYDTISSLITSFDTFRELFQVNGDPGVRKRNAWFVFVQPSKEVMLQIESRNRKRQFQLKSAVRGNANAKKGTLGTRKKSVEIFGVRDPLNEDSERQLMELKKKRKVSLMESS